MNPEIYSINKSKIIQRLDQVFNATSLDDASIQLPQGVYTTFRTYAGASRVLGLNNHLNRLFLPALRLGLDPSASPEEVRFALRKIMASTGSQEARVRISLSLTANPGQIFLMVEDLKPISEKYYQDGVCVITSKTGRDNPRLKSTAFIQQSSSDRKKLLVNNVYEVLLRKNRSISEGMTSNFYGFKAGRVITAQSGILLGITRHVILRLIRKEGCPIDYRSVTLDEMVGLQEAFISSSSRGVVPVVKIDTITIGQGRPGEFSKLLRKRYDAYVLNHAEVI